MPYEAPGVRHTCPSADKACVHGQIVTEDGFVGSAFKVDQIDRWVKPAQAGNIAIGEEFEIQLDGIHEAPAAGNLAPAVIGSDVYIRIADNVLGLAAQALNAGGPALNAGWLPVGKVTEIDVVRNPDVLRINSNVAHLVRGNFV